MNAAVSRQVLHTAMTTVARLELNHGAIVPRHSHPNEQITMIVSGALRFEFDREEIIVRAGEMLVIPGEEPHSAYALEDTVAVDLFAPPREDWIRGDDAYLRER